ncbi:MAG: SDR family NAD(P)-dependent oxidoreductase [Candidatus Dadabacteria bacterium]|nr:MAG: SDR family NAD(P)-dependent oxidoreductase [Candidatus Dadabacteria bacterium]
MRHDHHPETVWITGARQGLGAALADIWAARGARLVVCSRRWEDGEAVRRAAQWRAAGAADAQVATVDVGVAGQVEDWAVQNLAAGLAPTVVIHNAAILGPRAPLTEVSVADWEEIFRVNVHGAFFLLRALASRCDRQQPIAWGWLISSVARQGRAGWGPYAATKAALLNLHQTFSAEIADSAWRSIALNPGGTRTAMRRAAVPDEDPLTVPAAADVADAIVRILDDLADGRIEHGSDVDVRNWL